MISDGKQADAIQQEILSQIDKKTGHSIDANPNNTEQGLAKLVLAIIELLQQLLEKQALRRMDEQTVSDEQAERMGETFYLLDQKMDELCDVFGLQRSDLNIDLGPLGRLLS